MRRLFVLIKCELGRMEEVASALVNLDARPSVYSISDDYDLFAQFDLDDTQDIGRLVAETVHAIEGVRDTNTMVGFDPLARRPSSDPITAH